jgi:hypothetical protein
LGDLPEALDDRIDDRGALVEDEVEDANDQDTFDDLRGEVLNPRPGEREENRADGELDRRQDPEEADGGRLDGARTAITKPSISRRCSRAF